MIARSPHYFLWGNLVFASGPEDAWGAYRLEGESYPGLSLARKLELKDRISAFAYGVEADFQLIRTSRAWDPDSYRERALATLDRRAGHRERFEALLATHAELFRARRPLRPETYLLVRLGPPRSEAGPARLAELRRGLERLVGLREAQGIGARKLDELRVAESRCHERVLDYLPAERARSGEVAHLIRAAYTRGLGEPEVDPNWRPQALVVEELDGDPGALASSPTSTTSCACMSPGSRSRPGVCGSNRSSAPRTRRWWSSAPCRRRLPSPGRRASFCSRRSSSTSVSTRS